MSSFGPDQIGESFLAVTDSFLETICSLRIGSVRIRPEFMSDYDTYNSADILLNDKLILHQSLLVS